MEIFPNVHQIDVPFVGQFVSVYLLIGEHSLLIDTGVIDSPEAVIMPLNQDQIFTS